jgi:hypothetical protein
VTVSPGLASKPVVGFLIERQNQGGGGFLGLGLKTDSFGLVIRASKSLQRFLSLGLKTKRTSVCRLRHKTDGGRTAWNTRRDLATCFMLGFFQSVLKTDGGATAGGARGTIAEVVSESR